MARMRLLTITGSCLLVTLIAANVSAQPPGGFRGGWGGGDRGGGGGESGASSFLSRLDENGNGMIDPSESQGRMGFLLQRLAERNPRIDLSRPIPLQTLSAEFERMRSESSSGGGDRGGYRGRNDDDDDDDDRRRSYFSPSNAGAAALEPLVPGFGEIMELPPVLGFGVRDDFFSVPIDDDDREEAEEDLERYDRNRDGAIDSEELRRGRWSDNPLVYDANGDGRLNLSELTAREAYRRQQERGSRGGDRGSSGERGSSASSVRGFGGGPSPGSSGSSGGDRSSAMIGMLMQRYDSNGSGVLEKSEWSSFRSDPSSADANRDSKISREELTTWLASRMGGGGRDDGGRGGDSGRSRGGDGDRGGFTGGGFGGFSGGGIGGGGNDGYANNSDSESAEGPRSYRFLTPAERLPSGVPGWFPASDVNADGQVAMFEFTSNWSQAAVDDFAKFDLDGDGSITADESAIAAQNGAQRQTPVTPNAAASRTTSSASAGSNSGGAANAAELTAQLSGDPALANLSASNLKYFIDLMNKYDANKDSALTENEWGAMSKNLAAGDADGDGRVTVVELAKFYTAKK